MANPQLEDGHLRIANDIWDALCRIRIPGEVRQIIDTVLRKTWGFRKKQDWISLSQFHEATGISKPHIVRALRRGIAMNIIAKNGNPIAQKGNDITVTYSFNKDYESWRPLPKKVTLSKKVTVIAQKGKNRCPKRHPQHTIDTLTKDSNVEKGKRPYSEIISDLNEVLGTKYRERTRETRRAMDRWWKQGFRLDDFKKVHRIKADEWRDDPKMSKFLRPSTLYGPKFEDYLNQASQPQLEMEHSGLPDN